VIIGASGGSGILFIIVIAFLLLWLIVVRPQKKRQNQQQQMANELRIGDEVLTAGGIYGTVSGVTDDEVTVQIAPKTEVRVARRAIAGVNREPEEEGEEDEVASADDPQGDGGEKWQSAFDEEDGAEAETSPEENRG
jgi:preprotein translocase subunit YajC